MLKQRSSVFARLGRAVLSIIRGETGMKPISAIFGAVRGGLACGAHMGDAISQRRNARVCRNTKGRGASALHLRTCGCTLCLLALCRSDLDPRGFHGEAV